MFHVSCLTWGWYSYLYDYSPLMHLPSPIGVFAHISLMQGWQFMFHALPLPCILPLVGAHLPLASMELWFCLLNVLDIDSGLQVVLLLPGEVCSIL